MARCFAVFGEGFFFLECGIAMILEYFGGFSHRCNLTRFFVEIIDIRFKVNKRKGTLRCNQILLKRQP